MPSSWRWCQTPISNKHRWRSADEGFKRICRVILKCDQSVAILNKSRTSGNWNLRHLMWKVSWLKNAALNKSHGLWSPNGQEPGFKVTNAHILTRLTHSSQRYCLLWTKSSRIEVNIRKIFSKEWHTSNYWQDLLTKEQQVQGPGCLSIYALKYQNPQQVAAVWDMVKPTTRPSLTQILRPTTTTSTTKYRGEQLPQASA